MVSIGKHPKIALFQLSELLFIQINVGQYELSQYFMVILYIYIYTHVHIWQCGKPKNNMVAPLV